MAYPISIKKNNYHENKKCSTVLTPEIICKNIWKIVNHSNIKIQNVWDICCNSGNLSLQFKGKYNCYGVDIVDNSYHTPMFYYQLDFLSDNFKYEIYKEHISKDDLIVCNPPFNHEYKGVSKGKKLLPELFLKKMFEVWGEEVKIIMIVPMGFRLNQRMKSKRWKWLNNTKAKITSIMSLPIDIFDNVQFHSEILFFNIPNICPHYFLNEENYSENIFETL